MGYDIKNRPQKKGEKMGLPEIKMNAVSKPGVKDYPKNLTFFPLSEEAEELCQTIDKNLFQLEKGLAFFSFAIKDLKDITRT